jgi:hypothetical protein
LTGLVAVSVPIIIHILNRRRFKVRPWAAMKFLLESIRKNRRRIRIEELILLAIRCLVLLMLAMGIARFTGCSGTKFLPTSKGSETIVLLLDDSYSMGQKVGPRELFADAKNDVSEQIKNLAKQQSNRVAIILTSQPGAGDAFFKLNFISDTDSLLNKMESLRTSCQRSQLSEAMASAGECFKASPGAKKLYIYSDYRHSDLASPDQIGSIRKQFEALHKDGVEVHVLDYGRPPRDNLTVESIEMLDKFPVARVPLRLAITVRNNGEKDTQNVAVTVSQNVGAAKAPSTAPAGIPGAKSANPSQVVTIEKIAKGSTAKIEAQVTFPDPGPSYVSASLPQDELTRDDDANLALDVREFVRVLIVDGERDSIDPSKSESFFLARALDPRSDAGHGVSVDVRGPDEVDGIRWEDYDMVLMTNVEKFPPASDKDTKKIVYPALAGLEQYVRGGGGLAVFTGDKVDTRFYRDQMYADGNGLCPYWLKARVGDPANRDQYLRLDPKSIQGEGPLKLFAGKGVELSGFLRFFAFNEVDAQTGAKSSAEAAPPRVLARFTDKNNSPAIAVRQFGKGTVMMFLTSGSNKWNDWPIDEIGTFVVMAQDMVSYLAKGQEDKYTGTVGQPLIFNLPDRLLDAKASLDTPRHSEVDVITLQAAEEEKNILRYLPARDAGIYTLTLQTPLAKQDYYFARNVDPAEGDLTIDGIDATGPKAGQLDPEKRKKVVADAFGSSDLQYEMRGTGASATQAVNKPQHDYFLWALVAMLVLMAAEVYLAQRFGHYNT